MMKELIQEKGLWAAALLCLGGLAAGFPFYQMEAPLAPGSFLDFCQAALQGQVLLFLVPVAGVLRTGGGVCAGILQRVPEAVPYQDGPDGVHEEEDGAGLYGGVPAFFPGGCMDAGIGIFVCLSPGA